MSTKLAILGLSTFGYFERLAAAATNRGIESEFFDERPANDVFTKLLLRFLPKRIGRILIEHHIEMVRQRIVEGGFSHVLLVFAETFSVEDVIFLRNSGISVCRFSWDSLRNRPHLVTLDPFMDAIGSFDPDDCSSRGYTYIPLFSDPPSVGGILDKSQRNIDFYFYGTMHSDRAALIYRLEEIASQRCWKTSFKLFYHSRILYILRHWRDRRALALRHQVQDVAFPHQEILESCRNAKVVVDIHHASQSGLTMRSFEALAQGAVLLTTNPRAADLIDPSLQERVVFLDRGNLESSMLEAVSRPAGPLDLQQCENLSQDRFLDQIFSLLGITSD